MLSREFEPVDDCEGEESERTQIFQGGPCQDDSGAGGWYVFGTSRDGISGRGLFSVVGYLHQMEREMCHWEPMSSHDGKEFEDMVVGFAGTDPYPTYVCKRSSKLAARPPIPVTAIAPNTKYGPLPPVWNPAQRFPQNQTPLLRFDTQHPAKKPYLTHPTTSIHPNRILGDRRSRFTGSRPRRVGLYQTASRSLLHDTYRRLLASGSTLPQHLRTFQSGSLDLFAHLLIHL